jgi:hypothetical protein
LARQNWSDGSPIETSSECPHLVRSAKSSRATFIASSPDQLEPSV